MEPLDPRAVPAWQTGGAGAITGTVARPPAPIPGGGAVTLLLSYASTAAIVSLPPPTLTPTPTNGMSVGSRWFNSDDMTLAPTPILGCTYSNAWDAADASVLALCGAAAVGA